VKPRKRNPSRGVEPGVGRQGASSGGHFYGLEPFLLTTPAKTIRENTLRLKAST
jgi:hypothetical protein